jgi:hypothetical protein
VIGEKDIYLVFKKIIVQRVEFDEGCVTCPVLSGPLRKAIPVKTGMKSITATMDGKPYPVGTPIPTN